MKVVRPLVVAYCLMLVVVGVAGIVSARRELAHLYGLRFSAIAGLDEVTFLNQYRFLKAVELGAGCVCLLQLGAIMSGGKAGFGFLVLVAGGAGARLLAWLADGRPAPLFITFLVLEAIVLAAYLAAWRHGFDG